MGLMDFGDAIKALKQGKRVTRRGWNGKGMYLFLAHAMYDVPTRLPGDDDGLYAGDSICMRPAMPPIVVGWLASQTDMLAEDWEICG